MRSAERGEAGNRAEGAASVLPSARVSLVGAGPGDPGLATLRAVELLQQADLVLYDRLAPPGLLRHAPPSARRVCVDELPGRHPERVPHIHETMIEAARQGLRVVRLKGGDPFVFGRAGEEAAALRAAGIAFEIVPGVTAALAAAACAAIPLTHRHHASAVALVTAHEHPGKPDSKLDWAALARFPGTLVFYMAVARLDALVSGLIDHGKAADTPAAVVERASTPSQRTFTAPLAQLPELARRESLSAPALVFVGEVVRLRQEIAWFEDRPLFGQRILVTRPRHQAGELMRQIEILGGEALVLSTIEIGEPADWSTVDDVLTRLSSFDWLVFTSANGVHAFLNRLRHLGRDLRALGRVQLAVIGPATAEALRSYHLEADVMPASFHSEGLVAALRERVRGSHVLLARANRGLELLRDELSQVAQVEQVAVYEQRDAILDPTDPILVRLRQGEIDQVTLTSSNIARALIEQMDEQAREQVWSGRTALVCISPRTGDAVRERGLPVAAEATEYTTAGIVSALCALARRGAKSSTEIAVGIVRQVEHQAAGCNPKDVHEQTDPSKGDLQEDVEQEQQQQ